MRKMNREQSAASSGAGGVSLVIAGAGTGKTTTMIEKIINSVESGITSPENVLIMTFSRKAAEEIRERLEQRSSTLSEIGFAGTFHSFGLHLLKLFRNDYLLMRGTSTFPEIIDDDIKNDTMKSIVMKDPERFLGLPYEAVLSISGSMDRLNQYMMDKLKKSPLYSELQKVAEEYTCYKRVNNLIDYDDMINESSMLLERNIDIRQCIHNRFSYLFVDEFQDTSESSLKLLKLILPEKNCNLFMVGDDYQSIYKFRNAKVEYLINIKKYFPEASILKLTMNYRSRREIVSMTNRFIRQNRFRTDKLIKSFRGKGGTVIFHMAENARSEAELISRLVTSDKEKRKTGILYRNNYQGDLITKKLWPDTECNIELMTMHASKGLEFDVVIIAGVSDKVIPDRGSDIEEERRLFYVAMTRARDELHIIYHKNNRGRLPKFVWELGFREE